MTQKRYINYGATADAGGIKGIISNLANPGVLTGFDLVAVAPDQVKINPGGLVFESGVLLEETEIKYLTVPLTVAAIGYTMVYTHIDQDIIGGAAASLSLITGLFETYTDSVIIGWVKYPGSTFNLENKYIYPAPQANIYPRSTPGDKEVYYPRQGWVDVGGTDYATSVFGLQSEVAPSPLLPPIIEYSTDVLGGLHGIVARYANSTGSDVENEIVFPFVVHRDIPKSIIIEFAQSTYTLTMLTVEVIDTLGVTVTNVVTTDNPVALPATTGNTLITKTVRIVGGTFTVGKRYYVKLTAEVPIGRSLKIASVGASTYELPF